MPEPEQRPLEDLPMAIRGRIRELRDRLQADELKVWTEEEQLRLGFVWQKDAIMQTGKTGEYSNSSVMAKNTEEAISHVERVGELNRVSVDSVHTQLEQIRINAKLSFEA